MERRKRRQRGGHAMTAPLAAVLLSCLIQPAQTFFTGQIAPPHNSWRTSLLPRSSVAPAKPGNPAVVREGDGSQAAQPSAGGEKARRELGPVPEVLAPAGGREQFLAALNSGAYMVLVRCCPDSRVLEAPCELD